MELLPDLDLMSPVVQNGVNVQRQQHIAQQAALHPANDQHVVEPWTDEKQAGGLKKQAAGLKKEVGG